MKVVSLCYRRFSSSTTTSSSSSSLSSSLPWISPLHYSKRTVKKPDPPPQSTNSTSSLEVETKPRFITHESAINLIKRATDPQRALDIFNSVSEQNGFNHNNATYAIIINKLMISKKYKAIDAMLRQMTYETCKFHEGLFINLMKHFSKYSLHHRVIEMFNAIQSLVRQKPSLHAVSTCLNLLIESGQIDLARKFLLDSKNKYDLESSTCISNIMVKHHCKNGDLESAFEVMKVMKNSKSCPNLITYSTLIDGLCKCGRFREAMELFEEMVSKDKILPDALTYNVIISGFCREGKIDKATKMMDFMRKNGCQPNVYNYTSLMSGFCKEGMLQEAKNIFVEMKSCGLKPDSVMYRTLINCLCRSEKVDEALHLLKEMKEQECEVDAVIYNIILGGLCRESRFDEALGMVKKLPYQGVYLNKGSYRIVLNFLCKEGQIRKAVKLLSLMLRRGFVPHFATSNNLIIRLCDENRGNDAVMVLCGLVERGFKPEVDSWARVIELICRDRKQLFAFELLDELAT